MAHGPAFTGLALGNQTPVFFQDRLPGGGLTNGEDDRGTLSAYKRTVDSKLQKTVTRIVLAAVAIGAVGYGVRSYTSSKAAVVAATAKDAAAAANRVVPVVVVPVAQRDMPIYLDGLGNVLARAGEDRFARNELPVAPHVWAAAVGVRIADRTRPISIEGGVLLVRTATSVWANELSLLSETLVTRLRAAGVPIRSMRFRVGPIDPPERVTWVRSAKVPRPRPLEADLARAIARVPDAELREVIAEAAKTNLAWQTMTEPAVASGEPRAARAPRGAERESGRPAQESSASRGASRGTRGDA